MMRILLLMLLLTLISSCASTGEISACQENVSELQAAYDASEENLGRVSAEAERVANPQMFGRVASAAADVAGAKAALDSARQGCGVAP